ncbi:MAG: 6-phosphogluconolactonase [Cyanobacteria bacterium P01_D01_bin.105]
MAPTVEILSDRPALIQRAHEFMVTTLQSLIEKQGRVTIALSGGSTPKPLYESMVKANLPWEKIFVFWGDERYVPHDHEKSNFRMTSEAWLNRVPIPAENVFPVPTNAGDPAEDAAKYEEMIRAFFQMNANGIPAIDFVLQGMGDDGHTASLFPNTEALDVRDRLVTVGNHDGEPRLTFTVPVINHGQKIVFLIAGANKQAAVAKVFAEDADNYQYPSRFIQIASPHWLMDAEAAKGLPESFK